MHARSLTVFTIIMAAASFQRIVDLLYRWYIQLYSFH